jgi:hypothetical protein
VDSTGANLAFAFARDTGGDPVVEVRPYAINTTTMAWQSGSSTVINPLGAGTTYGTRLTASRWEPRPRFRWLIAAR